MGLKICTKSVFNQEKSSNLFELNFQQNFRSLWILAKGASKLGIPPHL